MAEAFRSQDYFLNASTGVFKDNTAGDITAQQLRDFLYSTYRPQMLNGFRLTTESGVPVSTSDRTSQGTIYLTPYLHNCIGLYDGTSWKTLQSAQVSLALTVTSGSNYDVFGYDNSGTLTLELSNAWTNATTRADALTTQDGVLVKDGATTRRYLGTIRASGSNVTADAAGGGTSTVGAKRFVWNKYNQVPRLLSVKDTTANWTYGTDTWRAANGQTAPANGVEFVVGEASAMIMAFLESHYQLSGDNSMAQTGLALDASNTSHATSAVYAQAAGILIVSQPVVYSGVPGLGYHYLQWVEKSVTGTNTFYGAGGNALQSQIRGWILC